MTGIDVQTVDGVLVVAPPGDIDLTNATDLRTAILDALPNERDAVVVDLSATQYLDSAGIRVLFSVARRLEERRRRLVIVAPAQAHIRRVLSIVDMERHATLHETVDGARRAVASERADGRG